MSKMKSIKNELVEMWSLVHSQMKKSYSALLHFDKDLAREVILLEERVNSSEVLINSDCENSFSLQSVYQVNIPYILGILKVSIILERIGDTIEQLANCILEFDKPFSHQLLNDTKTIELFKKTISLSGLALDSFEDGTEMFNQALEEKRQELDLLLREVNQIILKRLEKDSTDLNQLLTLFSIIKHLERVAEQMIAIPQTIFLEEAKVA